VSRGKSARSRQNHIAYRRQHGRQGSHPHTSSSILPPTLVSLARKPLPNTYLFNEALHSRHALDESELAAWDEDPPYVLEPVPEDTASERQCTQRLVEVMHGRRLREADEREKAVLCRYLDLPPSEVELDVFERMFAALREWERLETLVEGLRGGTRDTEMAHHLLQWRAREAFALHVKYMELSHKT
jgi:hypothetical protein